MSVCPNCKARLSCGCQKRKAINGKACCTKCVSILNQSLNKLNNIVKATPKPVRRVNKLHR